ncbi:hypothetical protein [Mesorhizobium sp.]|nr:hypothetical protein [Mesorhizobium sp.]
MLIATLNINNVNRRLYAKGEACNASRQSKNAKGGITPALFFAEKL